jgi:hypothetical protein
MIVHQIATSQPTFLLRVVVQINNDRRLWKTSCITSLLRARLKFTKELRSAHRLILRGHRKDDR